MSVRDTFTRPLLTVLFAAALIALWALRDVLMLMGFAAVLAFALEPLVALLERIRLPRGGAVSRSFAAAIVMLVLVAIGAWALAGVAWIVLYFAAMRYLRWLAPRLLNQRVHDRARLLTWLGPLLHVFGCGIGQLVGLVLYYNLLEWVRKDLKAIRKATA